MKEYQFSFEEICNHLAKTKTFKHKFNHNFELLPLVTSTRDRYEFEQGTRGVIGEYFRTILRENKDQKIEEILVSAVEDECFSDWNEKQKEQFLYVMTKSLFDEQSKLKILDASFFKYLDLEGITKGKQEHEKKIAEFSAAIFKPKSEDLEKLLSNTKYKLIQKIFDIQKSKTQGENTKKFIDLLPNLTNLFSEDFSMLAKNQDKFTKSFDLLLMHYIHTYLNQVCLQINTLSRGDESLVPLYYAYDTEENIRKTRKCVHQGYKLIGVAKEDLYAHIQTLNHLNYTTDKQFFGTKTEILNVAVKTETIQEWKKWMQVYIEKNELSLNDNQKDILAGEDLSQLIELHYQCIKQEYRKQKKQGTESRYGKTMEEIAQQYFVKRRGPLGYIYSLTPDFLNTLVAVCIKTEKMHISDLFIEFEKRGVFTDRDTQRKIITVLDELDLLIKKSDGGEAQYVKSVL